MIFPTVEDLQAASRGFSIGGDGDESEQRSSRGGLFMELKGYHGFRQVRHTQTHPEHGCQRISDLLVRGPGLPASPGVVARVLPEALPLTYQPRS